MSSNDASDLPNTGPAYPHTKPEVISFSNNNLSSFLESSQQQATTRATIGTTDDNTRRDPIIPAEPTNYSDSSSPLQSHHRPSLSAEGEQGVQTMSGNESIGRHSISQNAPGKLGERGENALGALGLGGAQVERPKEDQGVGEKIVTFLGA